MVKLQSLELIDTVLELGSDLQYTAVFKVIPVPFVPDFRCGCLLFLVTLDEETNEVPHGGKEATSKVQNQKRIEV
jgi:hypothetical protein